MYTIDSMSFLFPIVGNYGTLTIGTEPVKITEKPRKMYLLRNFSQDANIFIGTDENVTPETGMPILPGEVLYLNTASDIYAVSQYISEDLINENTRVELRYMIFH